MTPPSSLQLILFIHIASICDIVPEWFLTTLTNFLFMNEDPLPVMTQNLSQPLRPIVGINPTDNNMREHRVLIVNTPTEVISHCGECSLFIFYLFRINWNLTMISCKFSLCSLSLSCQRSECTFADSLACSHCGYCCCCFYTRRMSSNRSKTYE